jgi:hypothetical protein
VQELATVNVGDLAAGELALEAVAGESLDDLLLQVCSDGRQPCQVEGELEVAPSRVSASGAAI